MRGVNCIGHTLISIQCVCVLKILLVGEKKREKKTGIEITALSKCAMALWLLDHEQF